MSSPEKHAMVKTMTFLAGIFRTSFAYSSHGKTPRVMGSLTGRLSTIPPQDSDGDAGVRWPCVCV